MAWHLCDLCDCVAKPFGGLSTHVKGCWDAVKG